jgi:hypothetical protein
MARHELVEAVIAVLAAPAPVRHGDLPVKFSRSGIVTGEQAL